MAPSTPGRDPSTPPPAPPALPKGRIRKPSARVLEAQQTLGTIAVRATRNRAGTTAPQPTQNEPPSTAPQSSQYELPPFPTARESVSPERGERSTKLDDLARLIASLTETIAQQSSIIANQNSITESIRTDLAAIKAEQQYLKSQNAELQEVIGQQQDTINDLHERLKDTQVELKQVHDQLDAITRNQTINGTANSNPSPSYADVARTPPNSSPSNVRSLLSNGTTPSTMTNTLYCTIDVSRVASEDTDKVSAGAIRTTVEKEMRDTNEQTNWRCQAVTIDPRNPHRVRIACRDEEEHKAVKRVVEANLVQGARILRDDLYPIRVDSVNRTAVLDETGNIRIGAAEAFSKENDTQVAKVAWLSNRDVPKAYGSMVVYLNTQSDALRFLHEGFFCAGGESGYTKAFERRERPKQCYNCQEIVNHKAYQCNKAPVCGRCAKEGHNRDECTETILKCVPCGGPHESFSRHCRKLYPSQHE